MNDSDNRDCNYSDREWKPLLRARDPDALLCLWTKINEWCYTAVRRYCDDESVALSAAIKAFERILERFEQYQERGSFFGFCRIICVREVLEQCRYKHRNDGSLDDIEELGTDETDPATLVSENAIWQGLQSCWSNLDVTEQRVLELRYLIEHPVGSGEHGMRPAEVAKVMGKTKTHVGKIAFVARKKLLACLKECGFKDVNEFLAIFGE